ncbi:ABC transporter inner membrane protein [Caldovatus sediminis]|uniref:ABC transporter inner membrane protein n=2 Tax=Caldovatus TaxID=2041181 RepID=A0A8J2ZF45_9PROT|nr:MULTISPECIES: ABC transporter permease [Caldovatus]MBW8269942.1 ABC transporter permease [Caldovatus aquaticus]GGG49246.1 ABC transporter inner membrane protein [Caldovatus sediminis]
MNGRAATVAGYLAGFALLFALWHLAATLLVRSALFPPPLPVLERAAALIADGILQEQVGASLRRILQGFLIGSAAGIPIGLAIGSFRPVRALLEPWTEFFRFIPAVAMITVAVIWFGIGEESKVFLIAYTTVFVVVIATAAGVGAVGRDKIRAAQCLGATRLQVFRLVALPATVPYILTGMRLAMANSFVTIVAAELVASNDGLGKMLWDARLFMQIEDIFVALVALGLLGFATDRLFRLAIRAFAGRFNPTM